MIKRVFTGIPLRINCLLRPSRQANAGRVAKKARFKPYRGTSGFQLNHPGDDAGDNLRENLLKAHWGMLISGTAF